VVGGSVTSGAHAGIRACGALIGTDHAQLVGVAIIVIAVRAFAVLVQGIVLAELGTVAG